jgi:hypothetical protein
LEKSVYIVLPALAVGFRMYAPRTHRNILIKCDRDTRIHPDTDVG